jgi:DNA invertase Pin-like site-specific DNA recombinase
MPDHHPVPAALYLRTSTRQQSSSIQTQETAIREYAVREGFTIVRTYLDFGRSGLTLRNRPGLSALLSDVTSGNNNYRAVLVYDVSRWGRFQDADESAYYEFLCKDLNVPVHYCAETFFNDSQVPNFILKSLKRTMAGEYSREQSVKCFRGQKHLAELGFRIGAFPGYGLRRMCISTNGSQKGLLSAGETKSLSTDRVVLVPGPDEEVQCVRAIFAMAAKDHMSCQAIAAELNQRGIAYRPGRRWPDHAVSRILKSEKYTGSNVWNRTSKKLGSDTVCNPPNQWVRVHGAFPAVVDRATFEQAQAIFPHKPRWAVNELMWGAQRIEQQVLKSGHLPLYVSLGPSITTLRRRLPGLSWLRARRGTKLPDPKRGVINSRQRTLILRNSVFDTLHQLFPEKLTEFHLDGKSRPLLRLANGLVVSVIVCAQHQLKSRIKRWTLYPVAEEKAYTTLVCLEDGKRPQYFLIPSLNTRKVQCSVGANHTLFRAGIRLFELKDFYEAASLFSPTQNLPRGAEANERT